MGVIGYAHSSYVGDIENKKLITRYYFFFGGGIVTSCSKWQCTVLISTSEAKYVAISQRAREGIWIWWLLNELLPNDVVREMKMLGDNETNLTLTRDFESQNCMKHINVMHHHVCGLVEDGVILIKWVLSSYILADGLTKALSTWLFKRHWEKWAWWLRRAKEEQRIIVPEA